MSEVLINSRDGVVLAATLTLSVRTPAPAVIGLHGASGGTRADPLVARLHALLPPAGFTALTFDRRGEGESAGSPSLGNFEVQAQDAAAIAAWLRGLPEVTEVGTFGFSQGAWVGPVALREAGFRFLILAGACGVTPAAQMRFGVTAHLRRNGYDERAVEQALRARLLVEDHAHGSASAEDVRDVLAAAAREPWWELASLPAVPFDEQERAAWCVEMDFDPVPSIAAVDVPTLLLYGSDDLWLPVDESVAVWRRHHPDVEVAHAAGASHELRRDGQPAHEIEQRLLAWLNQLHSGVDRR
ncbi:MAG TPA: CocE/NonD family hydrolase [Gaiellaceae bacterium]|nr:CocE/NonD family hydrolase [Gaiellaceae bacterium]